MTRGARVSCESGVKRAQQGSKSTRSVHPLRPTRRLTARHCYQQKRDTYPDSIGSEMQALAASGSSVVQKCVAMKTQQPRQAQRAASSPIGGASSRLGCETRPFAHVARLAKSSRPRPLQPLCARPPPMRDSEGNVNSGQMLVFVPPHPLIKHWLAIARNEARFKICSSFSGRMH